MRRITFRLLVAVLTFTIGFTSAWLTSKILKVPQTLFSKPLVASPDPETKPSKFMPTFRGCGAGYAQLYELPDGQTMSEGSRWYVSSRKANIELRKMLSKAAKIIERVPHYKNRFGEDGERIIALFPIDENGRGGARIIWYGGGQSFLFIEAPTLELALEFESTNAYAF